MFKQFSKDKAAQSVIEFMVLVTFILASFFVFQNYILHGMSGRWKNTGDTFGFGRQYAPGKTTQCAYDFVYQNRWYNIDCYEQKCDCESIAFTSTGNPALCQDCILGCTIPECD